MGATGIGISQCVALISALEVRRNSKDDLAKKVLDFVIKGIMEPDSLAPMADGTSPSTVVDTPQPHTPFSPATPDSLPVAKKIKEHVDDDAGTGALRLDASLALVGTLIARGLVLWEFVQRRVKLDLIKFVQSNPEKRQVLPMLSFVEVLLTEKRRAAGGIMTQMDWQRLKCMRRIQPPSEAYEILKFIVQICDKSDDLKNHVVSSMQQVMQDSAMSRIASYEPANFWIDCVKICNMLFRCGTLEKSQNPFRHFSFVVESDRKGDILSSVQNIISRVSTYSINFDCIELRVLSDAWKGGHDEVDSYKDDGWEVWKAANAPLLQHFDEQLSDGTRVSLKKALKREEDVWFENHVVDMLLAELWRAPHKLQHIVHFTKALGICHSDRSSDHPAWFETQMLQVIFALLDCEPIKCGSTGLDLMFREFISSAAPSTSDAEDQQEHEQVPGHRAAFEAAVLHLVERYGVPQRPQHEMPEKSWNLIMKSRRDYTLRIMTQIDSLVAQTQAGNFRNEFLVSTDDPMENVFSQRPTLRSLQKACILRLQLLNAALMHLPDDDAILTMEMLQTAIKTITSVCSCAHLMCDVLGHTVYRSALASMDSVGLLTQSIDWYWLRQRSKNLNSDYARIYFKTELRQELLRGKLPRFVSEHLCADLLTDKSVDKARLTSVGVVRHVPVQTMVGGHQSADQASLPAEQGTTFDDDVSFDMDPWLLLEHNPQGVIKHKLANATRHPRKRLRWEFGPPAQSNPAHPPSHSAHPNLHHPQGGQVGVGGAARGVGMQYGAPPPPGHHNHMQHPGW